MSCFGHCCRDVTIVLTPYDVLRMKRSLGIDSSEFLEQVHAAPAERRAEIPHRDSEDGRGEQALPVPVRDRAAASTATARGHAACTRWAWPSRNRRRLTDMPFHFVIQEDICKGHGEGVSLSVREWIECQGIQEFEMMAGGFKELTLHDFWNSNKALTPQQSDMFYMACYDLDRFRRFVFETRFLSLFEVDEASVEALRTDDQELLDFAMQWLRFSIFGEKSMRLQSGSRTPGEAAVSPDSPNPVLVIGGGIAGLTAAVELADTGVEVVLVEKSASLGGRVARLHQYFPKLCPPACGLEMHYRRVRENAGITVLTLAEVTGVTGSAGDYEVAVRVRPRFVSEACTLCGDCARACPAERPDEFNYGLGTTRAAYLPHGVAYPAAYAIDRAACPEGCQACQDGVHLRRHPAGCAARGPRTFKVSADHCGHRMETVRCRQAGTPGLRQVPQCRDQRDAGADGRRGWADRRPDPAALRRQGAADSGVCAMRRFARRKPPALLFRRLLHRFPEARGVYSGALSRNGHHHFYIDIRTPGRLEEFGARVQRDADIRLVKGKVARVEENPATGDLLVTAEDTLANGRARSISNWWCWRPVSCRRPKASRGAGARRIRVRRVVTDRPGFTRPDASAGRPRFPRPCRMPPARH